MPMPISGLSPAAQQLLGVGDLPGAQPAEIDEERRKRLLAQRQQLAGPATRALLSGVGSYRI